jgi:hypothetical protein
MAIKAGSDVTIIDLLLVYGLSTASTVKWIYFAKNNGAKVINYSAWWYLLNWKDCVSGTWIIIDMSLYNAIKDFRDIWWLFIAAAGNDWKNHDDSSTRHFPDGFWETFTCGDLTLEWLDNIISVAAVWNLWDLPPWSDYGNGSVHIWAPWVDIYSTYIDKIEWENFIKWSFLSSWSSLPNYFTWAINWTW